MVQPSNANGVFRLLLAVCGGLCLADGGCAENQLTIDPARLASPYPGPLSIAVAPVLNFSGSSDFDRDRVADLMAGELGYVDGINVVPVSRVLAVLAQTGHREVESPSHALDICERLGADAILVLAVTEYDPYDPPVVGITAQLYGSVPRGGLAGELDPVLVSRQARSVAGGVPDVPASQPVAQYQRVFNAEHDHVVQRVKRFARLRDAGSSPYGWRLYLVSQEHFLRFCCAATLEGLFWPAGDRTSAASSQGEVKAQ